MRNELDVASRDHAAETRKGATALAIDFGRSTPSELTEFLGIEKRVVNALEARADHDLLPDGVRHVCSSSLLGRWQARSTCSVNLQGAGRAPDSQPAKR